MRHNPRTCNAFHSAAENFRDAGILEVSLGVMDAEAEEYVREGIAACTCQTAGSIPAQRQPGAGE